MAKGFDETQTIPKAPEGTPAGRGLLVVIVHEAQDVEGKYHTNPHVRLIFRGEDKNTKLKLQCTHLKSQRRRNMQRLLSLCNNLNLVAIILIGLYFDCDCTY